MKVHEETWAVHRDNGRIIVRVAEFPNDHGVALALDRSHMPRARLAAQAPAMARLLLEFVSHVHKGEPPSPDAVRLYAHQFATVLRAAGVIE